MLLSLLAIGCTTTRNARFAELDDFVQNHQYKDALSLLADQNVQNEIYLPTDHVLKYMDLGMLHFYAGDYQRAVEYLSQAEYLMEDLFTTSVLQAVGSMLVNDTVVDYPGEPHEDLYTNIFKALAFLEEGSFDDAYVEMRRLNNKLNLLEDKYSQLAESYSNADASTITVQAGRTNFHSSALAHYISLLIYRADGDLDAVRIDGENFVAAFAQQPAVYNFPQPDIAPLLQESEQVRLNVLAFTGRMPEKRSDRLFIRTAADRVLIIAQREGENGRVVLEEIDGFFWPGVPAGLQFTFELPRLVRLGSEVGRIEVFADGRSLGELDLIENMENVAAELYKVKEPLIYLKTIIRALAKGLVSHSVKADFGVIGEIMGIFGDVFAVVSEIADVRAARYYPGFAYGSEFRIDQGYHVVSIKYYDSDDNLRFIETYDEREYRVNRLHLLHSYVPR